jgi:hypothetical protein
VALRGMPTMGADNAISSPTGATNLCLHSSFEAMTGWTTGGTNTIAQSDEQVLEGAFSCKATYQDSAILVQRTQTLTAVAHVYAVSVYVPADFDATAVRLVASGFTSATGTITQSLDITGSDNDDRWVRILLGPFTPAAGDLVGTFRVDISGTPTAGRFIYVDAGQAEAGTVQTPYIPTSTTTVVREPSKWVA